MDAHFTCACTYEHVSIYKYIETCIGILINGSSFAINTSNGIELKSHDDVIKWKHFPRYWPFVREFTGPRWIPRTQASDAEL